MPPPLRNLSDLGYIIEREGVYYAEVLARDLRIHFTGPRRGRNKERASEDLAAIRAAATDHMTRAEALDAMRCKADKLKAEAKAARIGGTEVHDGGHRTRVRCVDNSGARKAIRGPIRYDERRAKADTELVCGAAASSTTTRADFLGALQKEAHRLQQTASLEVQVAMMLNKDKFDRQHMQTDSETELEVDPIHDEPFPDYDVSTREACERLANPPPPPRKKPRKDAPPANAAEATMRLAELLPSRSNPTELRSLIAARADVRVNLEGTPAGSVLRCVTSRAPVAYVREMRNILIDNGAVETEGDRKAWRSREMADMEEPVFLMNFHRDDREGGARAL